MFLFKNIRHNFGPQEILTLENPEVNAASSTAYLANIIKSKIESEKINIWDFSQSNYHIAIVTDDRGAYNIAKKFVSSSFGDIKLQTINNGYVSHFHIKITIHSIPKLMNYLNSKIIYPVYKLTTNFPRFQNNQIILRVPPHISIENIKNLIVKSNKVNIRMVGYGKKMKTYDGSEVEVSEPILEDTWNDPVIFKVTIHDKTTLVAHLSPQTQEKLNRLKITQTGANVCFEIGGTVFATFTLRGNSNIQSDVYLVKCNDPKEAKRLLQHMNIGVLSSLKLISHTKEECSSMFFLYLWLTIIFLLIGLFFYFNRKRYLAISMILSLILFVYFSYYNSAINTNMLITLSLQQLIFLIITLVEDKYRYYGSYFSIIYFCLNIIIYGYGGLFNNAYAECLVSESALSSGILLMVYNILKVIKFKSNDKNAHNLF